MNELPNPKSMTIERRVVGKGYAHDSAKLHVRGEAKYIDDMPDLPGTLHVAPILSPVSNGIQNALPKEVLKNSCLNASKDLPFSTFSMRLRQFDMVGITACGI